MELMQASNQWATRPDDERFLSLSAMFDHFQLVRDQSAERVVSSRKLNALPTEDNKGIMIAGPNGHPYAPTNWSFGQVAQLAEAPAGYLRTLPAPIAADCVNYGLQFKRNIEDVGVLLQRNGSDVLRAATGPRYGRIWNSDVMRGLMQLPDNWQVPGEFGVKVPVTKENTTLYASDRDMFVFLCDEVNRVEVPGRRNGKSGLMARGFFAWNSEVGDKTFGLGTFWFDYVCRNRIVWGAEGYQEIKIRHTASAPDRFLDEIQPALISYSKSSGEGIVKAIGAAKDARIDKVDEFLATRFGKRTVAALQAVHMLEEERPIETVWDAVTAVTAHARGLKHQDARVDLERQAGELLRQAA